MNYLFFKSKLSKSYPTGKLNGNTRSRGNKILDKSQKAYIQSSKCTGAKRNDISAQKMRTNIVFLVREIMVRIVPVHANIKIYYYSFIYIAFYALCNFLFYYLESWVDF